MALLTSISSANRVVEQGGTYLYNVEPAISDTTVAQRPEGQSTTLYDVILVRQWKAEVTYSKRYKYVGLAESAVDYLCNMIRNYYTKTFDTWAVGLKTVGSGASATAMYCYVRTDGAAPTVCASITPVHAEGAMWEIEVDVNATVEHYSDPVATGSATVPNDTTLMNLVSGIAGYPADASYTPPSNNNNGSAG
jgi:hypothetical protein